MPLRAVLQLRRWPAWAVQQLLSQDAQIAPQHVETWRRKRLLLLYARGRSADGRGERARIVQTGLQARLWQEGIRVTHNRVIAEGGASNARLILADRMYVYVVYM